MLRSTLLRIGVLSLLAGTALAQEPQPRIALSELPGRRFEAGGLALTIVKLDDHVAVGGDIRDVGVGYIVVRVANDSDGFLRFDPGQLVVVSKDGEQATIAYQRRDADRMVASAMPVAPRAHADMKYNLTARVRFPARIYYDSTLLAEIYD